MQPRRTGSQATSEKGKGKGKGKGEGQASTSPPPRPSYCRFFLKGGCRHGDECAFAHLSQDAMDAVDHAMANKMATAKAKPKAKAQAAQTRTVPLRPAMVIPAPQSADAGGWRTVRRRARTSP